MSFRFIPVGELDLIAPACGDRTWRFDPVANVLIRDDIGYEIDLDDLFESDREVLDWIGHVADKTLHDGVTWTENHLVDLVYAFLSTVGLCEPQRRGRTRRDVNEVRLLRLKTAPCMDCNGTFPPEAMDFDHRPGEQKVANVSQMKDARIKELTAELMKCDLVCSNCHRIRTASRRGAA